MYLKRYTAMQLNNLHYRCYSRYIAIYRWSHTFPVLLINNDVYFPLFLALISCFLSCHISPNSMDWHVALIPFTGNPAVLANWMAFLLLPSFCALRISKLYYQTERIRWTIHPSWPLRLLLHFSFWFFLKLKRVLSFVVEINLNFCPGSHCFWCGLL